MGRVVSRMNGKYAAYVSRQLTYVCDGIKEPPLFAGLARPDLRDKMAGLLGGGWLRLGGVNWDTFGFLARFLGLERDVTGTASPGERAAFLRRRK